jgi:hypothetical protein
MLSISFLGNTKSYQYYVNQFKDIVFSNSAISNIQYIQADGDELGYILNKFGNIPKLATDIKLEKELHNDSPRAYVMRWYGSDAAFIIGNLNI